MSGSGISAAVVSCAGACVPSLSGMSMTMNKHAGVTTEVLSPVCMPRLVDDGYPLPCSTRVGARSLASGLSPATVEFVPTLVSHTTCSTLSEPGYRAVLSPCLVPGSSAAGMVSVPSGMAGVITGVDGVGFSHDSSFTGLMTGPSGMTGMTASLSTDRVFRDSSSVAGLVSTPSGMTGLTAGIGTGCVTHTDSSVAGLVARPSGMTGVCTDVTTACVSSVFPSVTVCTSRPSGTTSDGSVGGLCLPRGKVGVSMVETGVSDKSSSSAEAVCMSGG